MPGQMHDHEVIDTNRSQQEIYAMKSLLDRVNKHGYSINEMNTVREDTALDISISYLHLNGLNVTTLYLI